MKPNLILRFSVGLAAAVLTLGVPATVQADTNVVANPGFEIGACSTRPIGGSSVLCGWSAFSEIFQDTSQPHSGAASMLASCPEDGCWGGGGDIFVGAESDFRFCASLGPGTHPASFWYRTSDYAEVELTGYFFEDATCSDWEVFYLGILRGEAVPDGAWHQVSGALVAPANTQSAIFHVGARSYCPEICSLSASFDDLDVELGRKISN
jgi:hypothetical protein